MDERHSERSWGWRRERHEGDDELRFHVYINPIGLTAWSWKGIRGEAFVAAALAALFLIGFLHLFWAGIIVPFVIVCIGAWLTTKHPFWPEVLWRAILQPLRFLDS